MEMVAPRGTTAALGAAAAFVLLKSISMASAATVCPRDTTALTSACERECFNGRPCLAYAANEAATCEDAPMTVCKTSKTSSCRYACFKYAPDDQIERNLEQYSSFTFLVPFGSFTSDWELKWNASDAAAASSTKHEDQTDRFPSMNDDVVAKIEPLTFLNSTKTVRIAGGSNVDGIHGRVSEVALATEVLLANPGIESLTLANLLLKEIPSSSFPPQLLNLSVTNCVMSSYPTDLLSMPQLQHLDLSKNYFKSVPAKFALPTLRSLNLSTNKIESFDAEFIQLTTLDLSDNLLTSVPTTVFSMASLQTLDLRKNSFTNVVLAASQAAFLANLTRLSIDSFGPATCDRTQQQTIGGAVVCVKASSEGASPSSSPPTTTSSGGANTAVVGGVVAGVVVLFIAVAVVMYVLRKRKAAGHAKGMVPTGANNNNSTAVSQHSVASLDSANTLWSDQELLALKVNSNDIDDIRKVGTGAFSVVYLVQYRETRLAAAKRLKKDEISWENTKHFIAEIKLVKRLEHPRIVGLLGVAWTMESDLQALFEYMENGDLRTYVEKPSTPRTWTREKIQITMDVVEALVYVHSFSPPLVHRDLKSRNILLDVNHRAKLSDFGVARFRSDQGTMTTGVGTGRWLAPEVIAGSNDYDQSSDIFAFGVVLSELDTHELPYEDIRGATGNRVADIALLQMVSAGKLVPTFSRSCPPEVLKLAMRCLAFDRSVRPTAVEVAYALRTIMRSPMFA